jgi:hypothetical protein
MFLLRGVEDRTGKLRIERAGQHAFENARARIPDFDAVRELIGLRCYNAKAPNLFTPSLIRGSQAHCRTPVNASGRSSGRPRYSCDAM